VVAPWSIDEYGVLTRTVTAIDAAEAQAEA
jgi:hypothetical protein